MHTVDKFFDFFLAHVVSFPSGSQAAAELPCSAAGRTALISFTLPYEEKEINGFAEIESVFLREIRFAERTAILKTGRAPGL